MFYFTLSHSYKEKKKLAIYLINSFLFVILRMQKSSGCVFLTFELVMIICSETVQVKHRKYFGFADVSVHLQSLQ